jgi:hypothetical protein
MVKTMLALLSRHFVTAALPGCCGNVTKPEESRLTWFHGTRHEYIPAGSTSASLPPTVPCHHVSLLGPPGENVKIFLYLNGKITHT